MSYILCIHGHQMHQSRAVGPGVLAQDAKLARLRHYQMDTTVNHNINTTEWKPPENRENALRTWSLCYPLLSRENPG
jgi:hypothetical protein